MTYHTSNPWLATAFFSDETISRVLEENKVIAPEGETNPDLIRPGGTSSLPQATEPSGTQPSVTEPAPTTQPTFPVSTLFDTEVIYEEDGVNITKINGENYVARLIRVSDPLPGIPGRYQQADEIRREASHHRKNNQRRPGQRRRL